MNAIETHGLTKKYGQKVAVDHIDFEVRKGEFYCLLGENGAGKTTTIKMLTCLSVPTEGDALMLGHSIVHDSYAVKQITNVSPQETAVAPNLTVRENLELIAGIYKCGDSKVDDMIKDLGLEKYKNSHAKTLSGGWQRRLSIAMALITDPEILFLDEPAQGLDVIAQRELWNFITQLKGKVTMVLTTHNMKEADALADRIGVLSGGKIRAVGTAAELVAQTGTKDLEDAFIKLVSGS